MVKLFGIKLTGGGGANHAINADSNNQQQNNNSNRRRWTRRKDRQSPTLPSMTPEIIREKFPSYQYALDEFAQTVPPGTSNSDGFEDFGNNNNDEDVGNAISSITNSNNSSGISRGINNNDNMNDLPYEELRNRKRNVNDVGENKSASVTSRSWTTIGTQALSMRGDDNPNSKQAGQLEQSIQSADNMRPTTAITPTSVPHWLQQNSRSSNNNNNYVAIPDDIQMMRSEGAGVEPSIQPETGPNKHFASPSPSLSQLWNQKQQYATPSEQQEQQQNQTPKLVYHSSSNVTPFNQRPGLDSFSMRVHHAQNDNNNAGNPMELSASASGSRQSSSGGGTAGNQTTKSTNVVQFTHNHHQSNLYQSPFYENDIPGATYEEFYGDAYTGGRLKYIYPSGYQSMRPRSCPWRLSIVICLLFTWLSIFIVGHCSDQVEYDENIISDELDDDKLVMDIRWCGSRPLYWMWVVSMLITGLSASYCSIIGYIKVRDFAVANSRSQPPGVVDGKSDYYVRIQDVTTPTATGRINNHMTADINNNNNGLPPSYHFQRIDTMGSSNGTIVSSPSTYVPTIYQADGTPQFWGSYIYRPTQAAVAITNR